MVAVAIAGRFGETSSGARRNTRALLRTTATTAALCAIAPVTGSSTPAAASPMRMIAIVNGARCSDRVHLECIGKPDQPRQATQLGAEQRDVGAPDSNLVQLGANATPTSAPRSTGASFTPSPTIMTTRPAAC